MLSSWPICKFLSRELGNCEKIQFATPAHHGQSQLFEPAAPLNLIRIEKADIPYLPKHIMEESEQIASNYYDTIATYYFPSGTSYAILAGIHAAFTKQDTVLVARNVHVSVLSALILIDAKIEWLCPDSHWFIFGAKQVDKALDSNPAITGVILTNPSYEGHCSDINAISEVCKRRSLKFVVDESLGSHWAGSRILPLSALQIGADLVFHSLHKRVGALVPAALLHIPKGSHMDLGVTEQYTKIFRSTSPSNPVLASIEASIMNHFNCVDSIDVASVVDACGSLRCKLADYQHDSVYEVLRDDYEPLVIHFIPRHGCPTYLAERMYNIKFNYEHSDKRGMIYIISPRESINSILLLGECLLSEVKNLKGPPVEIFKYPEPIHSMRPLEAIRRPSTYENLGRHLLGRVSAELVAVCPPGIPILIPGETITLWHCSILGDRLIRIARN